MMEKTDEDCETLANAGPNTPDSKNGAVLFADVSGSTPLYEEMGNQQAANIIGAFQEHLKAIVARHGGTFVKSAGDDLLCWFALPNDAHLAAYEMIQATGEGGLKVHAGLESGTFVCLDNDIFGDCVNAAARLCALSNPRELLVGEAAFKNLALASKRYYVSISPFRLKGRREASRVYSLQIVGDGDRTQILDQDHTENAAPKAVIDYQGRHWEISESEPLSVGRLPENALQVLVQTVSRQHATIRLANGLVEFEDHSSSGSLVVSQSGEQLAVLRRTVVLSGAGTIALGVKSDDPHAPRLFYEIGSP
ncbi:MAG: adenylate/guanylate cyclase domain-containing protein [Rhizobiales bacterium]|nr:adenylate/guanylate cyclase domain-containing protein [Hyphomicrobiales bacterium]MBO6912142.1 adenylate/guanylate cyclase domain-containing protein [Hyphomicrobiales bacterium]